MGKLDLTKPYRTRCGWKVVVVALPEPIDDAFFVGIVYRGDGRESCIWRHDGRVYGPTRDMSYDLIQVPETRTVKVWINVYDRKGDIAMCATNEGREHQDQYAARDRIACIEREITYTVGEGLEP
jgi:hypothetical protein